MERNTGSFSITKDKGKVTETMMNKEESYHAFEILYWCGIRLGELLALTAEDFDFEKKTLRINKSYQRIKGKDVITTPKTRKSNRVLTLPDFLAEEMQDYISRLPYLKVDDRYTAFQNSIKHVILNVPFDLYKH